MLTLSLPEVGATREAADRVVKSVLGRLATEPGAPVVVLGGDLLSSSESFTDQLVKRLFDGGAEQLVLVAVTDKFRTQSHEAARRRGFDGRVREDSAAALGV